MLRKLLCTALLTLLPLTSFAALSEQECITAAENVYAAQGILNQSPALFKQTHEQVLAGSPSDLGMSQELYELVTRAVSKLVPGSDPLKVGTAVFEGCKLNLKVI